LVAKEFGRDLKLCLLRVSLWVIFFHRRVHGAQFGASLVERVSGSETRKKFRHPMDTLGDHGRREMMGTAGHVSDDFGLLGIGNARLKHADDGGGAILPNAAKVNGLANNRRISVKTVRPKTIRENNDAGSLGAVILWTDEAPKHRTQTHHVEIGPVDHAAIDFARLAEADDREGDGRKVTKLAERFHLRL
jgi:hypothetical protein